MSTYGTNAGRWGLGCLALLVGCGVAGVEGERTGEVTSPELAAARASTRSPATRRTAAHSDGRVARYVVLEEPGAIASLAGRDFDRPETQQLLQKRLQGLRASHAALRPELEALGAVIVADMVLVANALQIRISPSELSAVRRLPGVRELQIPTVLQPSLSTVVPRVGAPQMWETAPGLHGEGMTIGIIDSGIDYLHADLGGAGDPAEFASNDPTLIEGGSFPTAKVVGGVDLAGNDYDPRGLTGSPTPAPDDDPLDCSGHGSHVAGIAAGSGALTDGSPYAGGYDASLDPDAFAVYPGAAPAASLFAIKIFGCEGSTDLLLAALELAVDPNGDGNTSDRLDVVNASLGTSFDRGSALEAEAIAALSDAGSLFVAAAGNDGRTYFDVDFPASVPQALAVAATLKDAEELSFLAMEVTAPASVAGTYAVGVTADAPDISTVGTLSAEVVTTEPDLACDPLSNAAELDGAIALVRRGTCSFNVKADNAAAAGAVGMLIVDNAFSDFPTTSFNGSGGHALPMWYLRRIDGEKLWAAAPMTAELAEGVTTEIVAGPDFPAIFSSRGPTADDLSLKPEVSAPGVSLGSVFIGTGWEAGYMSGTSMATPLVAGAAALLRQGRPTLDPQTVKELITSTARPMTNTTGSLWPTTVAGAGRIQIDDALATEISARVDGVAGEIGASFGALLASAALTESRTVVVTNRGSTSVDLEVTVEPSLDQPGIVVEASPTSLTVEAGASATVELSLAVDPAAVPPAPNYEPFNKTIAGYNLGDGAFDVPTIFLTEASGLLVFEQAGAPAAVVPYHGTVRPAAERTVDAAAGCLDGVGSGSASLTLAGTAAHHDNATSVLELGTESSSFSDPDGPDAARDIVAVGSLIDPDSGRLFFGVATAGNWATPARGWGSEVGIEIDVDDDASADFLVLAESFQQNDPQSLDVALVRAPYARVLNLATGALSTTFQPLNGAHAAYPGGTMYTDVETRESHVYLNRVLVFPVALADLGLDASATLSYRGVSDVSRAPLVLGLPMEEPLDTTDWVSLDAAAPRLGLPSCFDGTPLCPEDGGSIELSLPSEASALPTLLVLHHSNASGPRYETVELSGASFEAGDVSVVAEEPASSTITLDEQAVATFTITNTSGSALDGVAIDVTVTAGTLSDLQTSSGSCSGGSCELGALAVGASASVEVHADPTAVGDMAIEAVVASGYPCDVEPANDETSVTFAVSEAGGSSPSRVSEDDSGCGCALPGGSSPRGWAAALAALLLAGLRRRRRVD